MVSAHLSIQKKWRDLTWSRIGLKLNFTTSEKHPQDLMAVPTPKSGIDKVIICVHQKH